jgi:hypothetical protein
MKRSIGTAMAWTVGFLAVIGVLALIGRAANNGSLSVAPVGPQATPDVGVGEELLVVVGGVYSTREEAVAANASMQLADLQGYYVVPVAQFQGFREQVGVPGDFALVSAFRTDLGAQEFAEFVRSFGYPATILANRVRSLGGLYAGLGQERNLDGTGPLQGPIPESVP